MTIHLFALLHVATVLICRHAGIHDEIWLTMLTVAMTMLIGLMMQVKVEVIAASVILINLAGYLLGVYGARLMEFVSQSEPLTHALSTFLTTEILGWGTFAFLKVLGKATGNATRKRTARSDKRAAPPGKLKKEHIMWLVSALVLIIMFRAVLTLLFSKDWIHDANLMMTARTLLSRPGAMVVMLCVIVIVIRFVRLKCKGCSPETKTAIVIVSSIATSAAVALITGMPDLHADGLSARKFLQLSTLTMAIYLIFYSMIYMMDYAFAARAAMHEERLKANYAQFQYAKLKQQVNPHFLFNSLNILDCMVLDGQTDKASAFIHKLAGIYRYMLHNDQRTVPLKDEMTFVGMYTDLLKERFEGGFEVITDISPGLEQKNVIPCSVQMLVENAIKHNKVGGDGLLTIKITTEDGRLAVTNNMRPKVSSVTSTKVGLNYLKMQYLDLTGEAIGVSSDGQTFKVTIPLTADHTETSD